MSTTSNPHLVTRYQIQDSGTGLYYHCCINSTPHFGRKRNAYKVDSRAEVETVLRHLHILIAHRTKYLEIIKNQESHYG
jgi:hypothetical protein